jgi:glucose/arabinose dehydrogenase
MARVHRFPSQELPVVKHRMLRFAPSAFAATLGVTHQAVAAQGPIAYPELGVYDTERARIRVEVVAESLRVPSAIAFLPDGEALVAERAAGRLTLLNLVSGARSSIEGLPPVYAEGDGGLLDVILHPDYRRNGWLYFAYSIRDAAGATTVVDRARLRGFRLEDRQRLFAAVPGIENGHHFGARLVVHDRYLYIGLGDRDERDRSQQLDTHHGKIVRLHEDGRVPRDNPFTETADALPEIWSLGHRNIQGMTVRAGPALWAHEHGPFGGDEINIIRRGANYGWPVITYGREYEGGPVGEGLTAKLGMEQPVHYFIPSIAPSGMTFYSGDAFPVWRNNLFMGAMGLTHLGRYVFRGDTLVREERIFDGTPWRVRALAQSPEGFLYIGIDDGRLLRLRPADPPPYARRERLLRPEPFAGGRIHTVNGIAFTQDGRTLYTADWVDERDSTGRRRARIFEWRHDGSGWSGPTPVTFASRYTDYQPVMAPDGRRIYFQSTRPLPGDSAEVLQNLWYAERSGSGWGDAQPITALNTPHREGYPSVLADGTAYFVSDRPGGTGGHDFYRSRMVGGVWSAPEPVHELNTRDDENDLFVDPQERFVIFNRYVKATNAVDLFIAVRDGARWRPARRLDELNGPGWELTPSVSPDGQYLFYTVDGTIMQAELRPLLAMP